MKNSYVGDLRKNDPPEAGERDMETLSRSFSGKETGGVFPTEVSSPEGRLGYSLAYGKNLFLSRSHRRDFFVGKRGKSRNIVVFGRNSRLDETVEGKRLKSLSLKCYFHAL